MSEIRRCPFCHCEPEVGAQNDCVRCSAHVGWTPVAEWNGRPGEDALRAECQILRSDRDGWRKSAEDADEVFATSHGAYSEGFKRLSAELVEARALIAKYAEAERYYYHDESEYNSDRLNEASVALLDYAGEHK